MMQQPENIYQEGQVMLVDKPLRWTSFNVVSKVRSLVKAKVGHAGTLDPLATGLLILCTGRFTKKIGEYQAQEKEYTGTFTMGAVTPTYDLESEPGDFREYAHLSHQQLREQAAAFLGPQLQAPPAHSAIKQNGKPLYRLARKGVEVKTDPRPVEIKAFELTRIALPEIDFRVVCSTGTYIRSLAFDFGRALGCGAYLSALRRTRIGDFRVGDALTLQDLEEGIRAERIRTGIPLQN